MYDECNIRYPDDAPEAEHGNHGHGGFPRPSQDSRDTVGESEQEIKEGDGPGLRASIGNDFRCAIKGGNKGGDCKVDKNAYQFSHNNRTEDAETRAFFCPVILLCPKILADKSREGEGEASDRKKAETFYFGVCAAACNGHFAELVDVGLDDNIGKCNNGVLEAGGKTVGNNLAQHTKIETDVLYIHPVFFRAAVNQTEKA